MICPACDQETAPPCDLCRELAEILYKDDACRALALWNEKDRRHDPVADDVRRYKKKE